MKTLIFKNAHNCFKVSFVFFIIKNPPFVPIESPQRDASNTKKRRFLRTNITCRHPKLLQYNLAKKYSQITSKMTKKTFLKKNTLFFNSKFIFYIHELVQSGCEVSYEKLTTFFHGGVNANKMNNHKSLPNLRHLILSKLCP